MTITIPVYRSYSSHPFPFFLPFFLLPSLSPPPHIRQSPFHLCFRRATMVDDRNRLRFFAEQAKSEQTRARDGRTIRKTPAAGDTSWYGANGGNPFMARPRNFARFDWAATHFRKYPPVREFGLRFTGATYVSVFLDTAQGEGGGRKSGAIWLEGDD